jgi:hypothetical protein
MTKAQLDGQPSSADDGMCSLIFAAVHLASVVGLHYLDFSAPRRPCGGSCRAVSCPARIVHEPAARGADCCGFELWTSSKSRMPCRRDRVAA